MLFFFFLTVICWACPNHDLYAVGLNAYVVEIDGEALSLEMPVERGRLSKQPVVDSWRKILVSCDKENVHEAFEYFVGRTDYLHELGEEFQTQSVWRISRKRVLRKEIRKTEKGVAFAYADFLRTLQRETGSAVLWNRDSHPLVQGLISTARGSELVADYVVQMWE